MGIGKKRWEGGGRIEKIGRAGKVGRGGRAKEKWMGLPSTFVALRGLYLVMSYWNQPLTFFM